MKVKDQLVNSYEKFDPAKALEYAGGCCCSTCTCCTTSASVEEKDE